VSSSISLPTDAYRPGQCNIGPEEIRLRMLGGHLGVLASGGLLAMLLATHAPRASRLLVGLPAASAAVGYLQAQLRFCARFGWRGLYNFGRLGIEESVVDEAARRSDRRRAMAIAGGGALIGLVTAVVAYGLPSTPKE